MKLKVLIKALIDGPYGTIGYSSLWKIYNHEHIVLILYGNEVAPFASILQSVLYKYSGQNSSGLTYRWYDAVDVNFIKKIDFVWINKEFTNYEWFIQLLCDISNFEIFLKIKFFA